MISKKRDWKKGEYAIGIKIFTPDGGSIEYDCPHIPEKRGIGLPKAIQDLLTKAPPSGTMAITTTTSGHKNDKESDETQEDQG